MSALLPRIGAVEKEGDSKITLNLVLPEDLLYFNGHFPEAPILPGIVQTDWAIRYGREHFPLKGEFKALELVRFQQVLMAGDSCQLELKFELAANAVQFRYLSARGRHSSGTVIFG